MKQSYKKGKKDKRKGIKLQKTKRNYKKGKKDTGAKDPKK